MVRISLAPIRWKDSIELLQISVGCAKIRYIIKNIGYEEEEYAAGDGSESGHKAGRTLRRAGEGRFGAVPFGRGNGVML